METRLLNILKSENVKKFIDTILERPYKVLLVPSNLVVSRRLVSFLTVVKLLETMRNDTF